MPSFPEPIISFRTYGMITLFFLLLFRSRETDSCHIFVSLHSCSGRWLQAVPFREALTIPSLFHSRCASSQSKPFGSGGGPYVLLRRRRPGHSTVPRTSPAETGPRRPGNDAAEYVHPLLVRGEVCRRGAEALAVLEDGLVNVGDGLGELCHGTDAGGVGILQDLEGALLLVNGAADAAVDDEEAEDVADLGLGDVELLADPGELHAGVWGDELDDALGAHVAGHFVDIFGDERVGEDVLVVLEDGLVRVDVVSLVGVDELGHGGDAGVALVWFGLLGLEGVDVGAHEHDGEEEVLEDLDALEGAGLVVVVEGLEEVLVGVGPVFFAHVHLAAALSDNAHDLGVGDGRLDAEGALVQAFELLVVLHLGVHLNLEGVDLERVGALAGVIGAVFALAGSLELSDLLGQRGIFLAVEE